MHALETVDLYLRKSNKDERRSVERQLADLTDAAGGEGLEIGRVFVDPDLSASRFARKGRPDYAELLAHIHTGRCRVVGILEASRGSRSLTEWSGFLDLCRAGKIKIWVASHERIYDLSRRRDWRALADEGVDAADESEKISERVQSGKRKAAREGKPAGRLLYGYTRSYDEKGKLVAVLPHPVEAPIVAEMIRRVAKGDGLRAIADDLNGRGVTTPTGQPWRGTFIRQSVMRPSYAGRRVHQGQDVGEAMWPALVDRPTWERAVAVLSHPDRRTTTRGSALAHWLTGAVSCGACRTARLSFHSGGKSGRARYFCDSCGKVFVNAAALEAAVKAALRARLAKPEALDVFHARPDTNAIRDAAAELATLRSRLDSHYAEAAKGDLSAPGLSRMEGILLPEIDRAAAKLRRLSLPPALVELADVDVAAEWDDLEPTTQRAVARVLVDLVVMPAARRGPGFDPRRLDESRWTGDSRTWGEHWIADASA